MAGGIREKQLKEESIELDISSPYEDYSNMMKNFNSDSDLLQPLSPPPVPNSIHEVAKPVIKPQQCNISNNTVHTNDAKLSAVDASNPLDCGRCDVMREVMHINSKFITELSIHGQLGYFYHATLDVYHNLEGFPHAAEKSYIDLKNRDLDWIKQFLLEYGAVRRRENFNIINDWVSPFYAVVSASVNIKDEPKHTPGCQEINSPDQNSLFLVGEVPGSTSNVEVKYESTSPNTPNSDFIDTECPVREVKEEQCKTQLAKQRERTAKMQLEEIAKYFHLPLTEAAKELQICTSSLKAICRRYRIARWPQRKIKAIDNRILSLKKDLKSHAGISNSSKRIEAKIRLLKKTRTAICSAKGLSIV
ncbi:Protein RKD5 [Carex littledalei]|uniref:Protein RKD5 n=1 Tax=Carex littledalei TaxID=544730 RepID=A0A833R818_9POAL|nr:Protein RKD5 [Carex littledalei]